MTTKQPLSVGVYDDLESAERTIDQLRQHGFRDDEIGVIGHMGQEMDAVATPLAMKAPERNAVHGVSSGGIIGAIIGIFVVLVIPGLGELSGFGRWFEIVGGAVLGAAAGGFLLAFGSLFFSRLQGRFFEAQLEKGRFLVTVKNPQRHQEALNLLRRQAVHSATTAE
jgi:hypothetical protein